MSYRPEGFEEAKQHLISELLDGFDASSYANGIDDGADAMLEGLKKSSVLRERGSRSYTTYNENGYLVFIPEEE